MLKAIVDQRSHDEYESRMQLYIRPRFDSTPLVFGKPALLELFDDDRAVDRIRNLAVRSTAHVFLLLRVKTSTTA